MSLRLLAKVANCVQKFTQKTNNIFFVRAIVVVAIWNYVRSHRPPMDCVWYNSILEFALLFLACLCAELVLFVPFYWSTLRAETTAAVVEPK